jgi:hypothetical protein
MMPVLNKKMAGEQQQRQHQQGSLARASAGSHSSPVAWAGRLLQEGEGPAARPKTAL